MRLLATTAPFLLSLQRRSFMQTTPGFFSQQRIKPHSQILFSRAMPCRLIKNTTQEQRAAYTRSIKPDNISQLTVPYHPSVKREAMEKIRKYFPQA